MSFAIFPSTGAAREHGESAHRSSDSLPAKKIPIRLPRSRTNRFNPELALNSELGISQNSHAHGIVGEQVQKEHQALRLAYLTRVDVATDEFIDVAAELYATDPEGFETYTHSGKKKWLDQINPPDRELFTASWDKKVLKARQRIEETERQKLFQEVRADLWHGLVHVRDRAARAAADDDMEGVVENKAKFTSLLGQLADMGDVTARQRANLESDFDMNAVTVHVKSGFERIKQRGTAKDAEQFIATVEKRDDISPALRSALVRDIKRDYARHLQEQDFSEAVKLATAASGGDAVIDPENPNHKKAANMVWDSESEDMRSQGVSMTDVNTRATAFVHNTGLIPDSMIRELRRASMAPVAPRVAAADLVQRLTQLPGSPLRGMLGDHALAMFYLITELMASGHSPESATKQAHEAADITNRVQQGARDSAFKTIKSLSREDIARHCDMPLPLLEAAERGAGLEAEANAAFKQEYVFIGNEGLSRHRALERIKRTWGITRVGFSERLMKNPPELFYALDDDNDWMRQQLERDVSKIVSRRVDAGRISLKADDITQHQAWHGAPTYLILLRGDDETWGSIPGDRGAVRWRPNVTEERTRRHRAKQGQDLIPMAPKKGNNP